MEFIETRDDKVKGRQKFFARLLSDSSNKEDPVVKEQILRLKVKAEEKDEEIADLQELCKKFDMDRFRDKIQQRVSKCLEELEQNVSLYRESEAQYLTYMSKLLEDHSKAITYNDGKASDVYMVSLELYKTHL